MAFSNITERKHSFTILWCILYYPMDLILSDLFKRSLFFFNFYLFIICRVMRHVTSFCCQAQGPLRLEGKLHFHILKQFASLHTSNIVHPLVNSSITYVKKLSYGTLQKPGLQDIRMIKVPHEYHSLQSHTFHHLSKEAFIYLVSLSRQPVVDAYHDITCSGLSFYLQALEWFVTCYSSWKKNLLSDNLGSGFP